MFLLLLIIHLEVALHDLHTSFDATKEQRMQLSMPILFILRNLWSPDLQIYEFILGFFCRYMIRHYNMYIIKIIIYKCEARALTERVRRKLECSFP
ncbi:unnamed protein product [Albugo candida]|uniref:Uncharacterized protein n=1 Tax=Albugo candida TaxID=65357 RepID=A0A024FXI1_9STRA|nr:unnamed protein product [Albugo candida]|eukprot:CCI11607.1 unnamed protein product [Albugo candida]